MILASQGMIQEWTEKGAWGKKTLIDFFKENVKKDPDKECLVDSLNKKDLVGLEPERLTYSQLDRAVDATAESLIAKGIQKDDIIMVQFHESPRGDGRYSGEGDQERRSFHYENCRREFRVVKGKERGVL
jgi:hypothetical protein